jgi:hypothetical protein
MLRKGEVVGGLASIILVVGAVAVVGATFNSIQSQTLEDNSEGLIDSLEQYDSQVDIQNEEQFRGLVTWNMLASQQCLYANMIYNRGDVGQVPGDLEVGEEELAMNLADPAQILTDNGADIQNLEQGQFTFFGDANGDEDPLSTVVDETSFQGECVGTEPIAITQGPAAVLDSMTPDLFENGLQQLRGWSLEGRYGEVGYNMQNTVLIEDEKLFAMSIDQFWWGNLDGRNGPDFVRGGRSSIFIPPANAPEGIAGTIPMKYLGEGTSADDSLRNYGSLADGGRLWAFRVRMVNLPIIIEEGTYDIETKEKMYEGIFEEPYKRFVRNAEYILCKGSSGTVKSNAGQDPETDSVERGQDPVPRDVVYPVVRGLSDTKSCIGSDSPDSDTVIANRNGDYAPIGDKIYFSEEQPMTTTGYDSHIEPEYGIDQESGRFISEAEGELIIGEHEEDQVKMPYKSVLATTISEPLGLEWIDEASNDVYTREFGLDASECPENPHKAYDISGMNRIPETNDGDQTILYPVNRFKSEELRAEITLNPSVESGSEITVTAYSETGREMKSILRAVEGARQYLLKSPEGETLERFRSQGSGSIEVMYNYYAGGEQHMEVTHGQISQSESPWERVTNTGGDLKYIEISSSEGSFVVSDFALDAAPAGCEIQEEIGGTGR